ncbi:YraN family protein, partial [Shewanella sp. 0m-11]
MAPANPNQGQIAEYAARQYLQQRGLTFVEQNVRYRFGEIDIVMKDG